MCIDTTVRSTKRLGYQVTLIDDAYTTKDLLWHREILSAKLVHKVYIASLNNTFAQEKNCLDFLKK